MTDQEILEKVIQFRADGVSGSANFFDRMRKAEDFVLGEQWDPAVKEANRLKGKFSLTIPIIKSQIKQITGSEIQNPKDFIIKNTREGTATVAKILTALVKQATDSERVRYEESQAFESGLNTGQGCLGVFIDKRDDPRHGNLRIERLEEHSCLADPNCKSYNINKAETGAKYVIYEEWVDKDEVEVEYPDKKADLEGRGSHSFLEVQAGNINGIIDWLTGRRNTKGTGSFSSRERTDLEVMQKSRYLVSHTWWREPKQCVFWYDKRKSELEAKKLFKPKEMTAARKSAEANPETYSVEETTGYVMHHTIRVKDTFLEDRVDELSGVEMFPLSFFWPYWVNGHKSGIAEDLIGTQEEINWSHSMALNLVKAIANTGYKVKSDPTGEYSEWLKAHGSEDGIVLDESKAGGSIERIEPAPFPHQFELFTQRAMENARIITNIRSEVPEKDSKEISGKAIALKQQSSMQGSMSLFSNWNYTLSILGDLIVDIIRKSDIFSEDEIREIVDDEDLIDADLMDQAVQMTVQELSRGGIKIPDAPNQPALDVLQGAEPIVQQTMISNYQQGLALHSKAQGLVNQIARPLAEGMLMDTIRSIRSGKYSTTVTTSPMAETMRTLKAAEVRDLQKLLIDSGDVGLDGEDLIDATDVSNKEQLKLGREKRLQMAKGAA